MYTVSNKNSVEHAHQVFETSRVDLSWTLSRCSRQLRSCSSGRCIVRRCGAWRLCDLLGLGDRAGLGSSRCHACRGGILVSYNISGWAEVAIAKRWHPLEFTKCPNPVDLTTQESPHHKRWQLQCQSFNVDNMRRSMKSMAHMAHGSLFALLP